MYRSVKLIIMIHEMLTDLNKKFVCDSKLISYITAFINYFNSIIFFYHHSITHYVCVTLIVECGITKSIMLYTNKVLSQLIITDQSL